MSYREIKAAQRREIRARCQRLSTTQRTANSEAICRRLLEQDFWRNAKTVLLFAPLANEINVGPLLKESLAQGKVTALPRFDLAAQHYVAARITDPERDLASGAFAIPEPAAHCEKIEMSQFDLVLVPGVGFDRLGSRLGRGGGFYDRLLAGFTGVKCGIALDEQIVDTLPVEEHDARMTFVITPTQVIVVPRMQ